MKLELYGNVGSGKTTQTTLFGDVGYKILKEEFEDIVYLEKFYSTKVDKTYNTYCFPLQIHFLISYLEQGKIKESFKGNIIQDTGFLAGLAFTMIQYEQGFLNKDEYVTYMGFVEQLKEYFVTPSSKRVYISLAPEECLNRVQSRGREMELESINLSYLKGLHKCYLKIAEDFNIMVVPLEITDTPSITFNKIMTAIS